MKATGIDHQVDVAAVVNIAAPLDLLGVNYYFPQIVAPNFEWAWGYGPTFGIIEVDFETLERRPKKSADWYRDSIAANGFALPEEPATYRF